MKRRMALSLTLTLILLTICGVFPACMVQAPIINADVFDISPNPTPSHEDIMPENTPINAEPIAAEPTVVPSQDPEDTYAPVTLDPDGANDPNEDGTPPTPPVELSFEYDPERPAIALTFDDGPSTSVTPIILDVLKENDVRATFFVLGEMAIKAPGIVARAYDIGCEIGSHSYYHVNLTKLSAEQLHSQIDDVSEMLYEITGEPCKLVRPPYGSRDDHVRENVPFPLILWSIDTLDWSTRNSMSKEKSIQATIDSVLNHVKDGDIILMHDIHAETAEAVKIMVPELIARGYQLLTVSQLFEAKGIELHAGRDYRSIGASKR